MLVDALDGMGWLFGKEQASLGAGVRRRSAIQHLKNSVERFLAQRATAQNSCHKFGNL
jgi:hypothetical protein